MNGFFVAYPFKTPITCLYCFMINIQNFFV